MTNDKNMCFNNKFFNNQKLISEIINDEYKQTHKLIGL